MNTRTITYRSISCGGNSTSGSTTTVCNDSLSNSGPIPCASGRAQSSCELWHRHCASRCRCASDLSCGNGVRQAHHRGTDLQEESDWEEVTSTKIQHTGPPCWSWNVVRAQPLHSVYDVSVTVLAYFVQPLAMPPKTVDVHDGEGTA
jgi:hypothetical protein